MSSPTTHVMVEIAREEPTRLLIHTGAPDETVWLDKEGLQIERDDPFPGIATIAMPLELAEKMGLTE